MKILRPPAFAALSREKRSGIPQLIALFEAGGFVVVKIVNVEKLDLLNRYSRSGKDFAVYDKKYKDVVIEVRIRPDYLVFAAMLIPNRQIEKATFLVEVRKKTAKKKKGSKIAKGKSPRSK